MVKCAACGHKWKAMPDTELSDDDLDMLEPSPSPAPQPKAPEPVSEEPIPSSVRRVVQTQRRERAAKRGWLVWGAAAGVMLSLLATSVLFRNSVVSFWPKAASAYAVLGLQTSERGLVFGDIVAERLQQPSGPVLALRSKGRPVSMVRSRCKAACWGRAVVPVNQPSLVTFTSARLWAAWRATK